MEKETFSLLQLYNSLLVCLRLSLLDKNLSPIESGLFKMEPLKKRVKSYAAKNLFYTNLCDNFDSSTDAFAIFQLFCPKDIC